MNDITFELQQGGLGRPLPGEDHYSGLLFYTANGNLPTGFSTTNRVKQITSLPAAVAAGIKNDYADATAAAGIILVTAAGTNGDTITISAVTPGGTVLFGTYTKTASETTVTAVGAAIAAIINADTLDHGFSAVNTAGSVAITAPKKYGTYMNTGTKLVTVLSAAPTLAVTVTQFTGGVASLQAVWHYHISEFFRIQPKGVLFVGFYAVPGSYAYTELINIQNFAAGKIRQFGVYKDGTALAFADVVALHAVCNTMISQHKECAAILGADIHATADLTTLPDLSIRGAYNVMVDIGQDGAAQGSFLYSTNEKSITTLGATLGAVALAKVNESVAWVDKFNLSNGTELDVPALANGQLTMDANGVIDENFLDALEAKSYMFVRKFVGDAGTYRNEARTCVELDSDFAYFENVRTIQKAMRGVYKSLLPALGAPIVLNTDGTLQDHSIEYFKTLAERNLTQMERDQEISSKSVEIDPTQLVLVNGYLIISVEAQPVGVARKIKVPIGFTVKTA